MGNILKKSLLYLINLLSLAVFLVIPVYLVWHAPALLGSLVPFQEEAEVNPGPYGAEEVTPEEEIRRACEYVNADSFIYRLDNGLDEIVRERGNNFSAGQRQLLSFARTIIHKPAVMILDEATANIDTETELLIQDSLEKMKNIGTMLIVAHRLSTIQHADNIILLSHGEILEQGTHQELLRRKGRYYNLYTLQYNKEQLRRA